MSRRDLNTHATLLSLATAVRDLVDGLGGDDQEFDRAYTIAKTLEDLANGMPVTPIAEHAAAIGAWFAERGCDIYGNSIDDSLILTGHEVR